MSTSNRKCSKCGVDLHKDEILPDNTCKKCALADDSNEFYETQRIFNTFFITVCGTMG